MDEDKGVADLISFVNGIDYFFNHFSSSVSVRRQGATRRRHVGATDRAVGSQLSRILTLRSLSTPPDLVANRPNYGGHLKPNRPWQQQCSPR